MPVKNNIELGSGQLYYIGVDESLHPLDISEGAFTTEEKWAEDAEYLKLNKPAEFTFKCYDLQINREWTLVYCKHCRQPFPIIEFDAIIYGTDSWTCPLCTTIARRRVR